jgi:hypothetical protein
MICWKATGSSVLEHVRGAGGDHQDGELIPPVAADARVPAGAGLHLVVAILVDRGQAGPRVECLRALLGARRALQIGDTPLAAHCLEMFAVAAAARGDDHRAATILAAGEAARHAMNAEPDLDEEAIREQALKLLDQHGQAIAPGGTGEKALDLSTALSLATGADPTSA